jgi:uncharacterized protein YndB with AHSA1/START domain
MMISNANDAGPVVNFTAQFRAPREKLYRTWTEPDLLRKWFFADEGMRCAVAEMNLQALGPWKIAIEPLAGGDATVIYGHFIEVVPAQKLSYTWTGACADEQYWTLVTAQFDEDGKGSRILLTHGVFQTEADRAAHEQGWVGCLSQLERLLA